jgi:heme/copper-type cytochrome/quinol oxidase subunit 4
MLRMLARILGGQARNSTVIGSEPSAGIWRGKTGRSKLTKFAADFFAAEIRAWHGEEPLWKVFWVYGVATSVTIVAFWVVAIYDGRMALRQVLLPCFAAYTAWILVSVWRCAGNTKEKLWGTLARFLTVAWAGNTILVLTFLQLGLLMKYFQH